MKHRSLGRLGLLCLLFLIWTKTGMSQGVGDPLGIYGLDRFVAPDARTRAMGMAGIASAENAGALYTNPALLTTVRTLQLQIGGAYRSTFYSQNQDWYPTKPYATLSLLFEGKLAGIPDTNALQPIPLERAYDSIGPDWEKSSASTRPVSILAAIPFEFGNIRLVAGAGYAEAVNLDHYFQNNNALSPNVGAFQPEPTPRPVLGETIKVAWYQHFVERKGSVFGITPGLGVMLGEKIHVGVSATILSGTTDDREGRVERGMLRLTTSPTSNYNVYRIDSLHYRVNSTGTSEYAGVLPTLGFAYKNENVALGLTYRPSSDVTRSWSMIKAVDTTGSSSSIRTSGEDKIELPSNVSFGVAFFPHKRWKIGVDYVVNNYSDAVYTPSADSSRRPWLTGRYFRVGAELRLTEGLYLRGGYREDVRSYGPEGAPIAGDPIRGGAYTAGLGIALPYVVLDFAYEYSSTKYRDTWTSNVNYNSRTGSTLTAEMSVSL